jgi:antirestriction protein ArdC
VHSSRLAREGVSRAHAFGDENYSKEELVAEMGAAMLSGVAGIHQRTVANSAAYVASWLRVLQGGQQAGGAGIAPAPSVNGLLMPHAQSLPDLGCGLGLRHPRSSVVVGP